MDADTPPRGRRRNSKDVAVDMPLRYWTCPRHCQCGRGCPLGREVKGGAGVDVGVGGIADIGGRGSSGRGSSGSSDGGSGIGGSGIGGSVGVGGGVGVRVGGFDVLLLVVVARTGGKGRQIWPHVYFCTVSALCA